MNKFIPMIVIIAIIVGVVSVSAWSARPMKFGDPEIVFIKSSPTYNNNAPLKNLYGLPLHCNLLYAIFRTSNVYGSTSINPYYVSAIDFNNDDIISGIDFAIFAHNSKDDLWCKKHFDGWYLPT